MKNYDTWDKKTAISDKLITMVEHAVHAIVPDAAIILYGSRARGDAGCQSDWDFLILVDRAIPQSVVREIRDSIYAIELETDMIISSIMRTKTEWDSGQYSVLPFKRSVDTDGVMVAWTTT